MSTYHILNGDCLAEQLKQTKVNHDFIVCRECLIEGPLNAEKSDEFRKMRSRFISATYQVAETEYYSKTVKELEKIDDLPNGSEVCLWFENDLFCQVNMWFMLCLLSGKPGLKLFRVFPQIESEADQWKGFGMANAGKLEQCYAARVRFSGEDIETGKNLWLAYQAGNLKKLKELSEYQSDCFEFLKEVCQAHSDRFPADGGLGRPEKLVNELIAVHSENFMEIFTEFSSREGIYGFGDLQIKNIYDKLTNENL